MSPFFGQAPSARTNKHSPTAAASAKPCFLPDTNNSSAFKKQPTSLPHFSCALSLRLFAGGGASASEYKLISASACGFLSLHKQTLKGKQRKGSFRVSPASYSLLLLFFPSVAPHLHFPLPSEHTNRRREKKGENEKKRKRLVRSCDGCGVQPRPRRCGEGPPSYTFSPPFLLAKASERREGRRLLGGFFSFLLPFSGGWKSFRAVAWGLRRQAARRND